MRAYLKIKEPNKNVQRGGMLVSAGVMWKGPLPTLVKAKINQTKERRCGCYFICAGQVTA